MAQFCNYMWCHHFQSSRISSSSDSVQKRIQPVPSRTKWGRTTLVWCLIHLILWPEMKTFGMPSRDIYTNGSHKAYSGTVWQMLREDINFQGQRQRRGMNLSVQKSKTIKRLTLPFCCFNLNEITWTVLFRSSIPFVCCVQSIRGLFVCLSVVCIWEEFTLGGEHEILAYGDQIYQGGKRKQHLPVTSAFKINIEFCFIPLTIQ